MKQQKESDRVTLGQGNKTHQQIVSSRSSEKRQSELWSFGHLIIPSIPLREKAVRIAVIGRSKRRESGLPSFADLIRLSSSSERRQPGSPSAGVNVAVQIKISRLLFFNEFCLYVKVSSHHSLFVASPNVATSPPGHGAFACLLLAPEVLGNESHWKMSAFGSRFPHENFR